jgi:murein DD-endopeptidase MepM/ murein hydrolase activator NlpD
MSNRVAGTAFRTAALAGLLAGTAALAGCSSLGGLGFADRTTTGSVAAPARSSLNQPMPSSLPPVQSQTTRVAAGPFVPPENIGGGGGSSFVGSSPSGFQPAPAAGSVTTRDLPVLTSSTSNGNPQTMSAQPSTAPMTLAPRPAPLAPPPAALSAPQAVASLPTGDAYVHVIESGESLYAIARRYDTTAQAIVQANGMSSPDKIFVGQRLQIPGRTGQVASRAIGPAPVANDDDRTQSPVVTALAPNSGQALPERALQVPDAPAMQPVPPRAPISATVSEPPVSGADKFRWPLSGKVITDFAQSRGTGINIEAAEGAAVRAAENGTVIYTGDGVAGYGNLVLVRHANGFVSAYAHLKTIAVNRGDTINRGDNIGAVGMTGSVSKPQLHFELRKGATPVDPMPLLAS